MQFLFSDHVLDTDTRELRHREELIATEPQVFDLLVYLLENRDRVVTKDDLLTAIWGGRIVSGSTLTSRINAARKAVGDSGEHQILIRTIARKGVRFVGAVTESEPSDASANDVTSNQPTEQACARRFISAPLPTAFASLMRKSDRVRP